MPSYKAPLDDMRFVLNEVLDVSQLSKIKAFEAADTDTINQILGEVARVAQNVLAPLNAVGDAEGCSFDSKTRSVKTPTGFKQAYKQFCDSGLSTLTCDPDFGGMGMPQVLGIAMNEMFCSANLSFSMYPGLTHAAYNALREFGTDELKQTYLSKLVSGEWAGTMCLTEPHCGTDLGLIKTKAKKQADGTYAVTGTKIFISGGDQDLTGNICHLVLAKIDDPSTPPGTAGISLFLVPKFIPDAKGNPGERNPAFCGRIEEKMGIHGSSTCEMSFEGAKAYLVGEPNKGMKEMFVMMNEARMGVGMQGLGLSEVAYQNALVYAQDRLQGLPIQDPFDKNVAKPPVPIITHPDVRRELLSIKATVEGERMLAYWFSLQLDISQKHPDEETRRRAGKMVDLLTPIVKAHFTDNAVANTSSAMQVFGGHGYIKEHGMEQFYRDARILPIYEGTNGIQGLDLIGRKVMQLNLLPSYLKQLEADLATAKQNGVSAEFTRPVEDAVDKLKTATRRLKNHGLKAKTIGRVHMKGLKPYLAKEDMGPMKLEMAGMAPDYLKLTSLVAMGHMWVKMVDVAQQRLAENPEDRDFYETKIKTGRFYMEKIMPQSATLAKSMQNGSESLMEIAAEKFAHTQNNIGTKPREVKAEAKHHPGHKFFHGWGRK